MVSNAKFATYKEDFLKENEILPGFVLIRRLRDNMLSICRKDDANTCLTDEHNKHVLEPFEQNLAIPEPELKPKAEKTKAKNPKTAKTAKADAPKEEAVKEEAEDDEAPSEE